MIAFRKFNYDTVDSTNDLAKSLYESGEILAPTYVTAREQTKGRGTRGKSWCSPRDAGIYVTFVDPTERAVLPDTSILTLAAGVACADVLKQLFDVPIRLKPINDLYVDNRKLGGILTESIIQGPTIKAVFTGIGLNIKHIQRILPDQSIQPVSLQEILSPAAFNQIDPTAITDAIGTHLFEMHDLVWRGHADTVKNRFNDYATFA